MTIDKNNKSSNILLVEDDPALAFTIKDQLEEYGYTVKHCNNGIDAERTIFKNKFDMYLLDVMLPKKDGFTLAKELRDLQDNTPIIFLTAKELKEDIYKGFAAGGDDYITKPFEMQELIFRMEAILKRTRNKEPEIKVFNIGSYVLDAANLTLTLNDEEKQLTKKEAGLLEIMAKNINIPIKRETMLKKIWRDDSYFAGRSMDVYITKLRKYLKEDTSVEIQNVHGVGFKLVELEKNS
ncbi:MAG: response regulator transcription factor [Chitinophagales bacterium]|nr:response regulator transcription factor [Chitinophagales bacterium]